MTRKTETAALTGRSVVPLFALLLACLYIFLSFTPRTALAQEAFSPTRFSVEIVGEGPDVIMIPGLSTTREVWRGNAEQLKSEYRLHLVQVKGFGEPAGPNADGPVLQPLVEELARYIEANHIDHPAVVGHSLGGLVALMLGADHPDLPGRLMIVDSLPWYGAAVAPAGATPETIEPQARMLRDAMAAAQGTPQAAQMTESALAGYVVDKSKLLLLREWTKDADLRVSGQLAYDDLIADMRETIAGITAPLTMVYPWNETSPTQEQADAFYRQQYAALPTAQFIGIGPAGHFLMADRPEEFQDALAAFLAK